MSTFQKSNITQGIGYTRVNKNRNELFVDLIRKNMLLESVIPFYFLHRDLQMRNTETGEILNMVIYLPFGDDEQS